jgi:GTP cyclohydrolase I
MEDVQARSDFRQVPLDQVGVKDLRYPITVLDRNNNRQNTVASLSMAVGLPEHFKGAHMSRFLEVLNKHRGEMTMFTIPSILAELKLTMNATSATVEVQFPYFVERSAPVSGAKGLLDYECAFICQSSGERDDFVLKVSVPVTSLCPCSKAISDYGAHNQRGYLSIQVRTKRNADDLPELVWIEELIEIAEQAGSAPIYPVLKRSDERYVTMQAYDKPAFVEDMVRDVAVVLKNDRRVAWFKVDALNHESIHSHNVFANVEWSRVIADAPSDLELSAAITNKVY